MNEEYGDTAPSKPYQVPNGVPQQVLYRVTRIIGAGVYYS
ncbi:hypothetical protein Lser_V15G03851 [Lactuca serriola]